mmetsp:Transcript_26450/g.57964  ORF Transcript_26450/g.57964 Transcript_26450/m.57964 type:complete len:246 (+) Transcript_26450:243-980(+)|eukprot:CAMPEP_0168193634 /NCGR_PEP_ID=MMETSP0139_2-20121125/18715_1 /TAXON_ID=44445 /ORGANISM="Pseudo-nitzschia australis, Strain 10249 10 AB" /LENGTH=245 /DNA_ID=CAMNT_0008117011 /DNA_START=122 /DNA_END=859 /DNA_ORIENTATION=+
MQSSTSSPSSPPAENDHGILDTHRVAIDDARDRPSGGDGNIIVARTSNDHGLQQPNAAAAALSLSDNMPSSHSNNTSSSRRRRRRRRKKQANRELLLQTQLQEQQDCQQPQQSQPQIQPQPQEQEAEREILLPATTDTMARKSLFVLRPVHKYADLVCIALSVFAYLLETTMNAALAIFGIGVGVGLVLGDSFRAALPLLPSVQAQQQTTSNGTTTTANPATTIATRVENEIFLPRDVPNLLPAQ